MLLLRRLARIFEDPPPEYVFELSGAGIAYARHGHPPQTGFRRLEPGVVAVSPLEDNVLNAEALVAGVKAAGGANGSRKRKPAALILPDYCARVTVLDFDDFPSEPGEQMSLVRFRTKKTVPFDIDSAAVSYEVQPKQGGRKTVEVVVAAVALEIIARYEAAFRAAGYYPGFITTSALGVLRLLRGFGLTVAARWNGHTMTVSVQQGGALKLLRCVEFPEVGIPEVLAMLHPTFAFIEDELGARPDKLFLCGFGDFTGLFRAQCAEDLDVTVEPLQSRFGTPGPDNAGLLGYLDSVEV